MYICTPAACVWNATLVSTGAAMILGVSGSRSSASTSALNNVDTDKVIPIVLAVQVANCFMIALRIGRDMLDIFSFCFQEPRSPGCRYNLEIFECLLVPKKILLILKVK